MTRIVADVGGPVMPSPFPGMNPYLEQSYDWNEFHNNLVSRMQEYLSKRVGPKYFVKSEQRLYLHELSAEERRYIGRNDVGIGLRGEISPQEVRTSGVLTLTAPLQLQLPAVEFEKQLFLEIRDLRNRHLITVIEVLSPSNKTPGADREAYIEKRKQYFTGPVSFVEINLLRGGKAPSPPQIPDCDYYALVIQANLRPKVGVWPFGLRDELPVIPVPLADNDQPIELNLKEILDITYDAFGYGNHIYLETPEPPLRPEDDRWALAIVTSDSADPNATQPAPM